MSDGGRNDIFFVDVLDKQKRQNKDVLASKGKMAEKQTTL